jgi:hypothetical protein
MGQQQLLIVLLGVLIVGIAIAAGMGLFGANKVNANKDAIISDMNSIALSAFRFKSRPRAMVGGGGSYIGYALTDKYKSNANARYSCTAAESELTIIAVSASDSANTITGKIGSDGKLIKSQFVYTGEFE